MNRKDVILLITSVIVPLAIAEIGLRTFTPYPVSWTSNQVRHEKLGYVMDPGLAEIDKSGFRNKNQQPADIVAIGDSFTFGTNVTSDHSWPKALGRMLGKNVYNYGVGGYGLIQYSVLLDTAIERKPDAILVALYLTNDLDDVCRHVARFEYLKAQANQMGVDTSLCPDAYNPALEKFSISRILNDNVALYSILRTSYMRYRMGRMIDSNDQHDALIVNDGMQRTILHKLSLERNAPFVDLKNPHIAMGFSLLKDFLQKARRETQARNIRFGVLLIPSKERVFYGYLKEKGYKLSDEYEQLVENDDRLRKATAAFMKKIGVSSADVLPDMENAIRKYRNVYPATTDGHPLETGYQVYAEAAAKLVSGRQEKAGQ
jgi:lysophospholipase L1-like esterase